MQPLTAANLKAYLDANPATFKTGNVQPDGFLLTPDIGFALGAAIGTLPNPVKQATVSKPVTFASLAGACPTTLVSLPDADIAPIQQKLDAGDAQGLMNWAVLLNIRTINGVKVMSDAEKTAVMALCTATQPDPSYSPTIPGKSALETNFSNADGSVPCHSLPFSVINDALGRK